MAPNSTPTSKISMANIQIREIQDLRNTLNAKSICPPIVQF